MKLWKLSSLTVLFSMICISCKKECDMDVERELVNNKGHIITYSCLGDRIRFTIDAIGDYSDAIGGEWPDKDIYRLYIDQNRNGVIDAGVDLMLSPKNSTVCVVKLTGQNSTSTCTFDPEVTGLSGFGISENTTAKHTHFVVSIPKSLLSDGSKANIVIHVYDSETGWRYYPSDKPLFSDYFEVFW